VCPELTEKWAKAILKMPPSALKELVGRLQALEDISHQTNQELKAAQLVAVKDPEFIEPRHALNAPAKSMRPRFTTAFGCARCAAARIISTYAKGATSSLASPLAAEIDGARTSKAR
jgi:hypothetical protein